LFEALALMLFLSLESQPCRLALIDSEILEKQQKQKNAHN
jgi:hypothetical protein